MLELKDATLTLGGRRLFSGLSLMALDGQLTCVTGVPGAGLTPMLHVLLGLQPLDSGLVSIDGELLTALSAPVFRQLMTYVPQRREVTLSPVAASVEGLETVWAPFGHRRYQLTPVGDHLTVPPVGSRPIVIADDPDLSLLSLLKSHAGAGHTVVVASRREEYLNLSDKTITLG